MLKNKSNFGFFRIRFAENKTSYKYSYIKMKNMFALLRKTRKFSNIFKLNSYDSKRK